MTYSSTALILKQVNRAMIEGHVYASNIPILMLK